MIPGRYRPPLNADITTVPYSVTYKLSISKKSCLKYIKDHKIHKVIIKNSYLLDFRLFKFIFQAFFNEVLRTMGSHSFTARKKYFRKD